MVTSNDRFKLIRQSIAPWIVCFAASLFFFYEFIQGNMFASIADNIMHDFHIEADKMTYLSSIYYVSNVIFLFVAGVLLDRFSTKKITLVAMLLCIVSTFILAHADSFYIALTCRFITGVGSAFCFLGPIRIASRWFPPQRMALVTGAIVTMAMTGGMLAQYPLTRLVLEFGWRHSLSLIGWLGISLLLTMIFFVKDSPNKDAFNTRKKIPLLSTVKMAYLNSQTCRAALYASLMNMSVAVFGAMMGSLYLVQRLGIDKADAAIINSMLFLGSIIGGPLVGWCSDKIGLRILPMKIGAASSLLVILAILYAPISLITMGILFFLLGFCTSTQVISYALVAESNPAAMTASAVSMVSILTQGGYIVYQNLFSHLLVNHGDMTLLNGVPIYSLSDYQAAAIILPLGILLAGLIVSKLKETYCQRNTELSASTNDASSTLNFGVGG